MKKVKIACVQMRCADKREENLEKAAKYVTDAARQGAGIILLPELFERPYFCQERNYDYYSFAEPVNENAAVKKFLELSKKLNVVIPVSFYERDKNVLYNSVAVLDCGKNLGVYRKTHIPDDHYYQEKFYFTPGNTGFKTFKTTFGVIGVGICWDQWFPETARSLALNGAEILLYPTAIGSEPILGADSAGHWQRVMQGHAAANLVPVAAANRIGEEFVTPSKDNGGQNHRFASTAPRLSPIIRVKFLKNSVGKKRGLSAPSSTWTNLNATASSGDCSVTDAPDVIKI